jgi:hypothetical protein
MNTTIAYMYRDASNYKRHAEVVLAGELSEGGRQMIQAGLREGAMFIPSQVGLEDLQRSFGGGLYEDDHVWHEVLSIQPTALAPTMACAAEEWAARFAGIIWDAAAAAERVGLFPHD